MRRFATAMAAFIAAQQAMDDQELYPPVDEEDAVADAYSDALRGAMLCPVETVDELRDKLELIIGCDFNVQTDEVRAVLLADLRRLTGNRPSRTFSAKEWLQHFEYVGGGWVVQDGKPLLIVCEAGHATKALAQLDDSGCHDAVMALIVQKDAAKAFATA